MVEQRNPLDSEHSECSFPGDSGVNFTMASAVVMKSCGIRIIIQYATPRVIYTLYVLQGDKWLGEREPHACSNDFTIAVEPRITESVFSAIYIARSSGQSLDSSRYESREHLFVLTSAQLNRIPTVGSTVRKFGLRDHRHGYSTG